MLDHVLRNAKLRGRDTNVDIGIGQNGRIAAIESRIVSSAPGRDLGGRLVLPGFCDTHVHLDKACLLGRCGHQHGGLMDAIATVSRLKADFTPEDVYDRGARCLERAITQGTTHMRTHVELDPSIGLRSFEAIRQLKVDYAWALSLSICVFPQEGLLNRPGTEALLVAALENGADLLGGCPYVDSRPDDHITRLFDIARRFDVDLDIHLDFDLDPSWMHLDAVIRETDRRRWGGRVAIGHATKLSVLPADALTEIARRLSEAGVAVTTLPATDLYLMGRQHDGNVPRGVAPVHRLKTAGVTCSIATNNVMNPFTPFGDLSLLRMANLYANVCHAGPADFGSVLDLVTDEPARLMRLANYGMRIGADADFIVLDTADETEALAALPLPLQGFRQGRQTFQHEAARLLTPDDKPRPRLAAAG
jgi:cytosine deaminase